RAAPSATPAGRRPAARRWRARPRRGPVPAAPARRTASGPRHHEVGAVAGPADQRGVGLVGAVGERPRTLGRLAVSDVPLVEPAAPDLGVDVDVPGLVE